MPSSSIQLIVIRSVFVDRTLEFVAKFACSFLEKEKKEGENGEVEVDKQAEEEVEEEELPLFLYRLFAWLLDHHEVEGADARLRVCQLLNKNCLFKIAKEETVLCFVRNDAVFYVMFQAWRIMFLL